jgi:hypothetical protein
MYKLAIISCGLISRIFFLAYGEGHFVSPSLPEFLANIALQRMPASISTQCRPSLLESRHSLLSITRVKEFMDFPHRSTIPPPRVFSWRPSKFLTLFSKYKL